MATITDSQGFGATTDADGRELERTILRATGLGDQLGHDAVVPLRGRLLANVDPGTEPARQLLDEVSDHERR